MNANRDSATILLTGDKLPNHNPLDFGGESVLKEFPMLYRVPLMFSPRPEGGYTVTSPMLPEFLTEGETMEEAMDRVPDALSAVVELYEDLGKSVPLFFANSDDGGTSPQRQQGSVFLPC